MKTNGIRRITLVGQGVKDYKVPISGPIEREASALRRGFRKYTFSPGDKITGKTSVKRIKKDGKVAISISGFSKDLDLSVVHSFSLGVLKYYGSSDLESVYSHVPAVTVNYGGNVQNTAINLALALASPQLRDVLQSSSNELKITIASSGDPFRDLSDDLVATVRTYCDTYALPLNDRIALHVHYRDGQQTGTLAIGSEPMLTDKSLIELVKSDPIFEQQFRETTCFVSSDPIFEPLARYAAPGYVYIINASTAFRSLVADLSFDRAVILPMNNGEAGEVGRLLVVRRYDEDVPRPPFVSPITSNGEEIDLECLRQLDESLDILMTYNPPHRNLGCQSFTFPISFGGEGGLVVGMGQQDIACFTSVPSKEEVLLGEFGDPKKVCWDAMYEAGAGDSVATIIALFNTIDPTIFLKAHTKGKEASDRNLLELAGAIYVSLLGRIVGNFLLRTRDTHWSNIRPDLFFTMFDEAAKESLAVAKRVVKRLHSPVICNVDRWGIRVVLWRPGDVAYPQRTG